MARIEALNYIGKALNPETKDPIDRSYGLLLRYLIGGAGTLSVFGLIGLLTGRIEVMLGGGVVGAEEAVRNFGKLVIEDIREYKRETKANK